jgi:hypothetical protein
MGKRKSIFLRFLWGIVSLDTVADGVWNNGATVSDYQPLDAELIVRAKQD